MLILVEGAIHHPVAGDERAAVQAWLGPMVDEGFVQAGYLDSAASKLWMVVSWTHLDEAQQRLDDLPVVRDGAVTFTTTQVTALRFR